MLLLMELLLISSASEIRGQSKSPCTLEWLWLSEGLGSFGWGRNVPPSGREASAAGEWSLSSGCA